LMAVHIAAGFVALGAAPIAMLVTKGGKIHRRFGKIYFWSMIVVALTAVISVLAFQAPPWLSMVAAFAFYLALSGYRALYRKRPGLHPGVLDWGIVLFGLGAGIGLIAWAGWAFLSGHAGAFTVIALALGVTAAVLARNEMKELAKPSGDRRAWWFRHMTSMLGAYVATVTAFSATNFQFMPRVLRWLWPLVLGIVGITAWVRYYKLRFRSGASIGAAGAAAETEAKIA
jgi:uncharacterized membrane protein